MKSFGDESSLPDLSAILTRAHEIDQQTQHMAVTDRDLDDFITAAEESGLSRDAILQALRERMAYTPEAYQEGSLVFAKGVDDAWYVAKLVSTQGVTAEVRFLSGLTGSVAVVDLRPFQFSPGQKLQYESPSYYMWVEGVIERFNADSQSVTFKAWGMEETVPLDKVRVREKVSSPVGRAQATLVQVAVAAAAGGGVLGFLIGKLLGH